MIKTDNYEKLFNRLTKILERLYNGEELTVTELANDFDTSKRTIQRDFLERLEPNFPLEKVKTKWKMKKGHRLGRTEKQSDEIVLDIMESVTSMLGMNIFNKSKSLISKLKNDEESVFYTKLLFEDFSKRFKDFETLESSIKNSNRISFFHDNKKKIIEPYKILNLDGYWYLSGFNIKTNRLTTIKISKMTLIKELDETFTKNKEYDEKLKTAINGNFKPYRKLQTVELLIKDNPEKILNKIPISSTLKVIDRSDLEKWIQITVEVTDINEIKPFIKKNIPKIFVLSPKNLRDQIFEDTNKFLQDCEIYK